MPLVNEAHNIITMNIAAELGTQLRGTNVRAYVSTMRVRSAADGSYLYPDVVAVQGVGKFEDEYKDTLTNPAIVIEVLSPESELYDRGEKFAHYRKMLSVTTEPQNGLTLTSINCALPLTAIYENIEFEPSFLR